MNQQIVCAALKREDGAIVCGVRHFDSLMHRQIELQSPGPKWLRAEQGFVDNRGNFLTREEAYIVAEREGQIIRDKGNGLKLFSENLY